MIAFIGIGSLIVQILGAVGHSAIVGVCFDVSALGVVSAEGLFFAAYMVRIRCAWFFFCDDANRRAVEAQINDDTLDNLKKSDRGSLRSEASRLTRLLYSSVIARNSVIRVVSVLGLTTGSFPQLRQAVTELCSHQSGWTIAILAVGVGAIFCMLQIHDGWVREKIEMLATALGEDPRKLRLPRVSWVPKAVS